MADLKLCLKSQNGYSNSCFSDSDFSDDDDLGIDIDFDEHEMPYITSPVFPDLPKLKQNQNPWRVNAHGVQICDIGVGNDSDFAETKEMGVQVLCRNKEDNMNLNEADDKGICDNYDLQSNGKSENSYNEENGNDKRVIETDVLDKDHELIREVHIQNMDQNKNNSHPVQPLYKDAADDASSFGSIRDEYSVHDFSETDIEYSEDSSDDDFWQPQEDRRWVGVSPAKFRLLRRWYYD